MPIFATALTALRSDHPAITWGKPTFWGCVPVYRPGADQRTPRRVVIFIVVLLFGATLLATGRSLESVLTTLLGIGLASATVARWVIDDAPLPGISSFLNPVAEQGPAR